MATRGRIAGAFAGELAVAIALALALACGSHPDLGSDPQWGQGFSTRLADAGNPDDPSSVQQACALFGGPPYPYTSIDDLKAKLSRRWVGCGDNPAPAGDFWPAGFTGVQLDPAGTWQALVRAGDGSVQQATAGNAAGTYEVVRYPVGPSDRYGALFILYLLPAGVTDMYAGEQWEGEIEESPEILFVTSSTTSDAFRFSSAPL
jgi:hypothetical protein